MNRFSKLKFDFVYRPKYKQNPKSHGLKQFLKPTHGCNRATTSAADAPSPPLKLAGHDIDQRKFSEEKRGELKGAATVRC